MHYWVDRGEITGFLLPGFMVQLIQHVDIGLSGSDNFEKPQSPVLCMVQIEWRSMGKLAQPNGGKEAHNL